MRSQPAALSVCGAQRGKEDRVTPESQPQDWTAPLLDQIPAHGFYS